MVATPALRVETSTLTPASSKGKSLRTTVPRFIVRHFGLEEGDKITWDLEADTDGQFTVKVRTVTNDGKKTKPVRKRQS